MSKRLWVRSDVLDGYKSHSSWKLGTVVGEARLQHQDMFSLKSALEGPKMHKRYLIELDDGSVVEAWDWETFEPVEPTPTN